MILFPGAAGELCRKGPAARTSETETDQLVESSITDPTLVAVVALLGREFGASSKPLIRITVDITHHDPDAQISSILNHTGSIAQDLFI